MLVYFALQISSYLSYKNEPIMYLSISLPEND